MIAAITEDLPMYTTNPADITGLNASSASFLSPGRLSRMNSQHTDTAQVCDYRLRDGLRPHALL